MSLESVSLIYLIDYCETYFANKCGIMIIFGMPEMDKLYYDYSNCKFNDE